MTRKDIVVGTIGAGFIGSFHSYALAMQPLVKNRLPVNIRKKTIVDINKAFLDEAVDRFSYEQSGDDWRAMLADPEINMLINASPNDLHAEPCIAAAKKGIPIFCEKPLARTADEAHGMWKAVADAGVLNQAAFIYRWIPAVQYMKQIIDSGDLGELVHYRASYLMGDYNNPDMKMSWRVDRSVAGTGTFGDLGSHHIDLARYLIGEIDEVSAVARVNRPEIDGRQIEVDDAFVSTVTFDSGLIGSILATRVAAGYGHFGRIEVDFTRGSLVFQVGKLNELHIADGLDPGFREIQVIKPEHPLADFWWEGGIQGSHPISWVDCFVHQMYHFLGAVNGDWDVGPKAATFEDGYRTAEIVDHMISSWETRQHVKVKYRTV